MTQNLRKCPKCGKVSLFWNKYSDIYECLSTECKVTIARGEIEDRPEDYGVDTESRKRGLTKDEGDTTKISPSGSSASGTEESTPPVAQRKVLLEWDSRSGQYIQKDKRTKRSSSSGEDFGKRNTGRTGRKWFNVLGIIAIVLVVASIIMTVFVQNRITTAREDGSDEGEAQGYSNGYEEGSTVGYETGSEDGYSRGDAGGYEDGLETGYEEGKGEGYIQGFASGHEESMPIGYEAGIEEGYLSGDKAGYESGIEEGYTDGYASGFEEGTGTDYLVRNPTYNEVLDMLDESEATSAEQINNDFEVEGIRTGYVWVSIAEGGGYILVAFETIDKGLIFIRPSSDEEVELEVGKRYSELCGYSVPDFDDTITKVTIVW